LVLLIVMTQSRECKPSRSVDKTSGGERWKRTHALASLLVVTAPRRWNLALIAFADAAGFERAHAVLGPEGAIAEEVDLEISEVSCPREIQQERYELRITGLDLVEIAACKPRAGLSSWQTVTH
jgi:hypothetical protein